MKTPTLILLLFCGTFAFSQNFDLNTYKYRYQKWQGMGFNFQFEGWHNQYNNESEYTIRNINNKDSVIIDKSDQNNHTVLVNAPFFFFRNINTERLQQSQNGNYNSRLNFNKKLANAEHNLRYSINNRFYSNKNFTELNFSTSNNYDVKNIRNEPGYSLIKQQYTNLSYNVSVGKGRGRLEYVSDAVSAMFLLKDLKEKAGIGGYSNEQIEKVAQGITAVRNTRFLDFRFRLIDQLTMLDSILKASGIKENNSIRMFTTINDNWVFANRFERFSGSRWSVLLTHEGKLNLYDNKGESPDSGYSYEIKTTQRNSGNGIQLNYTHSKQLSLYVQSKFELNFRSAVNFFTMKDNKWDVKWKSDNVYGVFSGNYSILIQPNTRTYLISNIEAAYTLQNDLNGMRQSNIMENHQEYAYANANISVQFFRFLTQNLYYGAETNFGVNMNTSKYTNKEKLNNYQSFSANMFAFRMGLTYLFF